MLRNADAFQYCWRFLQEQTQVLKQPEVGTMMREIRQLAAHNQKQFAAI
ncbi:hypothetical protein QUB63_31520 [Microcoleus sp. ARI1-B5]